jgi:hypothetical protein
LGTQRDGQTDEKEEQIVAETNIKITADTKQAEREIKRLETALDDINGVAHGAATALAAITAAAGAMGYAILKTLDSAGALIDASKALGISAQSLQTLEHAAALAGVSAEELNGSLIRMTNNLGSGFASGTGPAVDAMKRLGISMNTIMGMRADQQFATIAAELNKITNPAERNAVAIDLLGKQGPRLLEVANNTEAARKEMEKLGLALSDIDVAALDMAGDSVDALKGIFDAGLKKAVAEIAPYIVAIVNKIKEAIEEAGGFEAVWQSIKSAIKTALNIAIFTAVIFALSKMVAFAIGLAAAIRTAGVAMGLFNAIVMRNPLMLAVGAALLLAKVLGIDVAGAVGDALMPTLDLEKANEQIAVKANEIKAANEATVEVSKELNKEQQKALDTLNETLTKLEQSNQFERDKIALGEAQANINKMIADESAKLEKVNLSLTQQQKERIANAYNELKATKDLETINKAIRDQDAERVGLGIMDKDVREQLVAVAKMEAELKRSMTADEKERLNTSIQLTQEAKKQHDVAQAIYDYTRKQTELEKINRGIDLQKTLGGGVFGGVTSEKEYQKDQEALQAMLDNKLISEQQYYQQREELARQYNLKIQELELKRIETVLMAERSGMAVAMSDQDRATLQKIGANERQKAIVQERIEFEKKSELQKTQFILEQGVAIFSALGAQNKKAFEAAKAFNIANAIMNTYMAATKALATYPFPFGLIAAAGAVAAGLAQVAQIRAQTYSGRALGGPVMGGKSYIVGESGPELFTPNTTGSITRNNDLQGGGTTNVNFTIVANDTTGFDQLLASRKGVIQQIISDAMLEKGRRSMV